MKDIEKLSEKKGKFIPSMSQLRSAISELPDPSSTLDEICVLPIDGNQSKTVEFERIILKKSDGTKSAKWSYKGRIFIDSKYYAKSVRAKETKR